MFLYNCYNSAFILCSESTYVDCLKRSRMKLTTFFVCVTGQHPVAILLLQVLFDMNNVVILIHTVILCIHVVHCVSLLMSLESERGIRAVKPHMVRGRERLI